MELTTTPVSVMMDLKEEIVIMILIIASHLLVLTVRAINRTLKVYVLSIYKFTSLLVIGTLNPKQLNFIIFEKGKKIYVLLNVSRWWLCSRQNTMFPHKECCLFFCFQ